MLHSVKEDILPTAIIQKETSKKYKHKRVWFILIYFVYFIYGTNGLQKRDEII